MSKPTVQSAIAGLLTPAGILAFCLTVGIISMIMFSVMPPEYYVIIWSMSVGYFYRGTENRPTVLIDGYAQEVKKP